MLQCLTVDRRRWPQRSPHELGTQENQAASSLFVGVLSAPDVIQVDRPSSQRLGTMLYQDFDLLIDRNGDSLRAQVLNSPAGQASADFTLPFSEDKLEIYLLRLSRTNRVTRRVESQDMNTAKT